MITRFAGILLILITPLMVAAQGPPQPPEAPQAPRAPRAPRPPRPPREVHSRDDYHRGQSALDKHEYADAVEYFNSVIEAKGDRADGALYWRAYADNKLGKRQEALATLAELRRTYPNSRWLEDAQALEVEVKQASGARVSPEGVMDEDTKLLILNGLMESDPERALPTLEKLLKSSNSPKVKERALFVLAQSHSQKSHELVAQVAKGRYNPDLQAKAVEYLSIFGGKENAQILQDVYKSTGDAQLKRSVLHGFMISGNRAAVLAVAKTETDPALRVDAIQQLAVMGGAADMLQLYTPNAPADVKRAVLHGLFISGQADKLVEIARNDRDPEMRREAVKMIGTMGRGKAGDGLTALYPKETDPSVKREILRAMFIQGNAPGLIEAARKEKDLDLKREAVQNLSHMNSKEARDFLLEMLNQ